MVVSDTQEVVITNEFGKWVVSLLSHEDEMSHPIVVPMFRTLDVSEAYSFATNYVALHHVNDELALQGIDIDAPLTEIWELL